MSKWTLEMESYFKKYSHQIFKRKKKKEKTKYIQFFMSTGLLFLAHLLSHSLPRHDFICIYSGCLLFWLSVQSQLSLYPLEHLSVRHRVTERPSQVDGGLNPVKASPLLLAVFVAYRHLSVETKQTKKIWTKDGLKKSLHKYKIKTLVNNLCYSCMSD